MVRASKRPENVVRHCWRKGLLPGYRVVDSNYDSKRVSLVGRARQFRAGWGARVLSVAVCAASLFILCYMVRGFLRGNTPESASYTTYICTETGQSFRHENKMGETLPIYSRFSGKNTGMPAEACYWTTDGKPKIDPTWVLLNEEIGKSGPTFCPDCGRLVVGHNPRARPGMQPPPTRSKYAARRSAPGAVNDLR